jgi:trehalose 6-phosphate phosphatase
MVIEIVPPLEANKGTAVRRLLEERNLEHALYAGDDTTDLDAFAAVARLELGIRVAVASAEGPPDLKEQADIVLDRQSEILELLRAL